jgi:Arc/MetJ family transcription regulator
MRTTLALDDELFAQAQAHTGLSETPAVVQEAPRAPVERESARRMARMGGGAPDFPAAPRPRPWEE